MLPIAARKAFGENASVLPVPRRTAAAPIASAVRIIVPRLPGSCNASSAAISPCGKILRAFGSSQIRRSYRRRNPLRSGSVAHRFKHGAAHGKKLRTECRNPCFKIRASLLNKQRFRHNARLQRIKNKPFTLDKVLPALPPRRTIPQAAHRFYNFVFVLMISIFGCLAAKGLIRRPPAGLHAQADRRRMYS